MLQSVLIQQVGEVLAEREDVAAQELARSWTFLGLGAGVYILCVVIGIVIYTVVDNDAILLIMLILGFPIATIVAGIASSHWFSDKTQYEERLEAAVIENVASNIDMEDISITEHENKTRHGEAYSAELIGLSSGEYVNFTARYNEEHGLMIPVQESSANITAREGSDLETLFNNSDSE